MNKKINKIPEFLKIEKIRNDKRIVVFMACLAIATGLWFLNALSKNYTTTISYPVRYVSAPNKQFLANTPPAKLELKVEAYGFTLLRNKLSLSFSPIILNLTNITKGNTSQNGTYSIQSASLMRQISSQISNEISVLEINPEIIPLVLDSLKTKTVPVNANIKLGFKPQFNLKNPVSVQPKEVTITGPSAIIDTISVLLTEKKSYDQLDEPIEKNLNVKHPEKTNISPNHVVLKVDVEKYTEKVLRIPVFVKNKPDNVNVKLFPSEVNVSCRVGLSEFENVTANNFSAYVDYREILENTEKLAVHTENKSNYIQLVQTRPEVVEYLIETN